ncbi:low temperature requirement protein A [Microbacterium sp. cx-55]|uniref:low temperature requirement protein A n=1 Tax=Microbacterium sp. cx-55 TaxID=2875948 RepID=UPI001CBC7982|nr:low temperature requirement protein A [Microbacterium sp. cx-55]MBZ4485827.1 low temperature requirement protein A [Microbacterium sp. cx-55]UGB34293.1 low temperature requirement protein A [Microbacterium sp. cx-55]
MPTPSSRHAGLRRMAALNPRAPHRVASPLELLFDLVFVVAVSQASSTLHELIVEGHVGQGVLSYLMVFFAVWWAWMNFTWFASAYDTDDWLYRVMTIAQMGGVLVLAAGVHEAMVSFDYTIVTLGYVIMRLAMVGQWLRLAISDPASRATGLRFAAGYGLVQLLWLVRLLADDSVQFWTFFVLMAAELCVPVWAEFRHRTPWHPHHIAERFGLFTLILLGESLLASTNAMIDALSEGEHVAELLWLSASGVVITAAIWWIYFAREPVDRLRRPLDGFTFGYRHYVVFAAVGAVSSGVEVEIDAVSGHAAISGESAGLALTLPLAIFLLAVWHVLLRRAVSRGVTVIVLIATALIAASGLLPVGEYAVAALLMAGVVAAVEVDAARRPSQL